MHVKQDKERGGGGDKERQRGRERGEQDREGETIKWKKSKRNIKRRE